MRRTIGLGIQLAGYVLEELLELGAKAWHEAVNLFLDGLADVSVLEVVEEVAHGLHVVQFFVRRVHDTHHVVQLFDEIDQQVGVLHVDLGQVGADQLADKEEVGFSSDQLFSSFFQKPKKNKLKLQTEKKTKQLKKSKNFNI